MNHRPTTRESDTPGVPSAGIFIVLEGADFTGKSTQAPRLAQAIARTGLDVYATCNPSRGVVGQEIRRRLGAGEATDPMLMALLFAADRKMWLDGGVIAALAAGHVVVSDRYRFSSYAFQGAADGYRLQAWVRDLNRHFPAPDLTLVLQVPPEIAAARRGTRGCDSFDRDAARQVLVDAVYRDLPLMHPEERAVLVDAQGTQEDVHGRILDAVRGAFPGLGLGR